MVALLALHQFVRHRTRGWLFGIAWLLQALTNGYYLLFFPVLIALWLLWFPRVLDASPLLRFWNRLSVWHRPEGELFPGLTAAVILAIAVGA